MIELNKIYNADCIDILKTMPDKCIDLVLTDPPYEQEFHGGGLSKRAKDYNKVKNNTDFMNFGYDYENILPELVRVCKIPNIILFCSNSQIAKTMTFFENNNIKPTLLIWHKPNACPLGNGKYISDIEYVIYARGKGATFNDVAVNKKYKVKSFPFVANKTHPAQKPLPLLEEYIEMHSKEGDTVLDCFSGSGNTCIACKSMNRNYIGIEKNEEYYNYSIKRMEVENSRKRLF